MSRYRGRLHLPSARLAVTPQDDRVRVAGIMEFGSPDTPLRPARIESMVRAVRPFLDGVDWEGRRDEWVGARPLTTDGVPLVGESRTAGLFVAGGHGMWGMTLGPLTGKLLAERIATGVTPPVLRAARPVSLSEADAVAPPVVHGQDAGPRLTASSSVAQMTAGRYRPAVHDFALRDHLVPVEQVHHSAHVVRHHPDDRADRRGRLLTQLDETMALGRATSGASPSSGTTPWPLSQSGLSLVKDLLPTSTTAWPDTAVLTTVAATATATAPRGRSESDLLAVVEHVGAGSLFGHGTGGRRDGGRSGAGAHCGGRDPHSARDSTACPSASVSSAAAPAGAEVSR